MMKQYLKIASAVVSLVAVFLFTSCPPLAQSPITPGNQGTPPAAGSAAPSFFWGNWVRMDNGQEYLITETKMVTGGGHLMTSLATPIHP